MAQGRSVRTLAARLPGLPGLLNATVFAPPVPPGARRRWGIVVALLGAAASIPVSLRRQPGSAVHNLWAEDGSIFLTAAYAHPLHAVLLTRYAGYVAVYPRLVAEVGARVPVAQAPLVMALGGALACAAAVFMTVVGSEGHFRLLAPRALIGAGIALFPLAGNEISANTCNAQWYFIVAALWAVLWRSRSLAGGVLAGLILALGASNDPLLGLFLPLAVLRAVAMPRWRDNVAGIGLLVGLAFQVPSLLHPALGAPRTHPGAATLALAWLYRGPTEALLGPQLPRHLGAAGIALGAAVLVLAIVVTGVAGTRGAWLAVLATLVSAVVFGVSVDIRWNIGMAALRAMTFDSRYDLVPAVLCLTVFALAADALGNRFRGAAAAVLTVFGIATVVLAVAALPLDRHRRPSVSEQLPAARAHCATLAAAAATARTGTAEPAGGPTAQLRGAPSRFWLTTVPCRLLITVAPDG